MPVRHGGCLCGAVRYSVSGALRPVVACHCRQCRKTSGHYVAATAAANADLHVELDAGLRWYRSSDFAQRGFCARCGSSLFWKRDGADNTSIMAGTLDGATELKLVTHIYVADKGDYYRLDDGLAQYSANTP